MIDWNARAKQPLVPGTVEDAFLAAPSITTPMALFSIDGAKREFLPYAAKIEEMVRQSKAHEVKDDVTNTQAVAMTGQVKKLLKEIETARKAIIEKPDSFVRSVNGFVKSFTDQIKSIEDDLKRKSAEYTYQLELERRKREREAQEEARKLQERINAEAKAAHVEAPVITMPVMPPPPKVTRTEYGSQHIRLDWVFEVEKPELVPREYLCVDERKIKDAVKAGVRNISGVKIYEKPTAITRL